MARTFLPDLIKILGKNKAYSEKIYRKLGYSDEISFEEFYIWWYHFIYSQATDLMNDGTTLTIPADGNFAYEAEQD